MTMRRPISHLCCRSVHSTRVCFAAIALGLLGASVACGGEESDDATASGWDPGGDSTTLRFEANEPLLPTLDFDSGWQPETSPASIRARATAFGGVQIGVDAAADDDGLSAVPGTGDLSLEGGIELELSARIDTSGVSYEGIVDSFRYEIDPQSVTFDSFLLDDATEVFVDLPARDLGSVPIPSVPGASLAFEVTGGQVETTYAGACAQTDGEYAQVTGILSTSGTVDCAASIVIEVPIVGEEVFGPFPFTVDIPHTNTDVSLGTLAVASGEAADEHDVCDGTAVAGGAADDTPDSDSGASTADDGSDPDEPTDGTSGQDAACQDEATCNSYVLCARETGGGCAYPSEVCEYDEECQGLTQCQNECSTLPTQQAQWCTVACFDAHPEGIDNYLELASCLAGVCDTQCAAG